MKILCWLGFHDWDFVDGRIQLTPSVWVESNYERCTRCGECRETNN